MGLNNYHIYDKEKVDRFTTRINRQRATKAEKQLIKATGELPDKMHPMSGAKGQHIGRMEVEVGEAHFLTMLTRDLSRQHDRPVKAIDIGTFTGHSAGAIARGMMHKGGKVITCDLQNARSDRWLKIAKRYWKAEGVTEVIEVKRGPASKILDDLLAAGKKNSFDIIFIDADKPSYKEYYQKAVELLRPGGKVVLDNMLWSGRVAKPHLKDRDTEALRALNYEIGKDPRVDSVLLNADDGIMIAEKLDFTIHAKRAVGKKRPI